MLGDLGDHVRSGDKSVVWIYDNIQRNYIARNQTVSNKTTMQTGTAATVLIMDGLTFEDLINGLDQEYLDNIGKAILLSIWMKHIPSLRTFSPKATNLFTNKYKKCPLRLWKSIYYSLKTSNIDESQPAGAKDVLTDIASQLKLQEANLVTSSFL
ncbi:hypothetical protein BJ322DRAFT_1111408 [Thelephora terrestris]|uniref:DUF6589 domain-containing protein n=1 Tax=Thelephora terrestris TaxID=56493 RepID=A0A9P6H8D9_9AGAM|nr:hypothetical protein BJ322DRAFT_1111408 [Thelephora terrestris]